MIASLFNSMADASDMLIVWLATTSLQLILIGGAVAILDRIIQHRIWPQLRAALWWLVILAPVVAPVFDSPLSIWRLGDPVSVVMQYVPQSDRSGSGSVTSEVVGGVGLAERDHVGIETRQISYGPVFVWLTGFLISGLSATYRWHRTRRDWLCHRLDPCPAWFATVVRDTATRIGLRRPPVVQILDGVPSAAVIGLIRPIVVVPSEILGTARRDQIEHVLLHEFAHIRRYDAWKCAFGQLVQAVFWFHPIVWLARTRLAALREICCDQSVAMRLESASSYRETILHMARGLLTPASTPPLAFIRGHSQIMARLMYLQKPLPRHPRAVKFAVSILFGILLITFTPRLHPAPRQLQNAKNDLAELPGCMQLRYTVMRAIADEQQLASNSVNSERL